MSNDFQSYQTYNGGEALPENIPHYNPVRIIGGAHSVSTLNGEIVETFRAHDSGRVSELNPHHGAESILATAQHPKGLPVYAIQDDTLLTVNGVQAPASFWEKQGVLTRDPKGDFIENTEAPQVSTEVAPIGGATASSSDQVPLPADHAQLLQHAFTLEGPNGEPLPMQEVHALSVCQESA